MAHNKFALLEGWVEHLPYITKGSPSGRPPSLGQQWLLALRVEVQYADLDSNQHVSNLVAVRWFQEARFRYKRAFLQPLLCAGDLTVGQVVRKANILYDRQILIGDLIEVYMCVTKVGSTSWTYGYRAWSVRTKEWVLTGDTVMVYFDHKKQTKVPLTEGFRAALQSLALVKAHL